MSQRTSYSYGILLPKGPKGDIGNGLGVTLTHGAALSLIPPPTLLPRPVRR